MAGAKFTIDSDSRAVLDTLNELLRRGRDTDPVLRDMGEYLLIAHRERFAHQQSPDGTPWAPLNPKYQARKKRNREKILVLDGYLSGLLHYDVEGGVLRFGTDRIYGATHQFGRPDDGIPARPWLGLAAEDEQGLLAIAQEHLLAASS